jgi:hypothetical protein
LIQPVSQRCGLAKAALAVSPAGPDATLRLLSVVLGTATIPALAWTTSAFLPAGAVLATTAALAVSPFHLWYSQEVRPYVLLVLIAILLMGAYLRALASNRAGAWMLVAVLTIALHAPDRARAPGGRRRALVGVARPRRRAERVAAAAGLAYPRWCSGSVGTAPIIRRSAPGRWLDLPYAFYAYVGFSLGPSTTDLHGTTAPLVPHARDRDRDRRARRAGRRALATRRLGRSCRPSLGLAARAARARVRRRGQQRQPFQRAYAILAFPPFIVLLGSARPTARRRVGIAAFGMLALSLVSLANLYFDPRYAKEDARGLATALAAETAPDDLVVVNAAYMASAVAYYYRGPARVVGYPPEPARSLSPAAAGEILELVSGHPHVWLILSRTFHGDRTGVLAHVLGSHLTPDRELRFDGILAERFATR